MYRMVVFFYHELDVMCFFFFFQAEDGIRDYKVTGVQTCALPISPENAARSSKNVGCNTKNLGEPECDEPYFSSDNCFRAAIIVTSSPTMPAIAIAPSN